MRLALGCEQNVVSVDGEQTIVVCRLKPYDYSGKTILTIKDYDENIEKKSGE